MRIKLLLLSMIGAVTMAHAQFTVTDIDNEVINDGDIFEFGSIVYAESEFEFFVTNDNPSEAIYTRIKLVEATNSTTNKVGQLCYGLCYVDVAVGETVPPLSEIAKAIPVGVTTGPGDHVWGNDAGNGIDPVDFKLTISQYADEAGTIETGTPLSFIYRYNPSLGTIDNNKLDLVIESTIISNTLNLKVNEPMSVIVYDLKGSVVKQANLEVGSQQIDMSNLSAQAYLLQFKNEKGGTQSTKVIVK